MSILSWIEDQRKLKLLNAPNITIQTRMGVKGFGRDVTIVELFYISSI